MCPRLLLLEPTFIAVKLDIYLLTRNRYVSCTDIRIDIRYRKPNETSLVIIEEISGREIFEPVETARTLSGQSN